MGSGLFCSVLDWQVCRCVLGTGGIGEGPWQVFHGDSSTFSVSNLSLWALGSSVLGSIMAPSAQKSQGEQLGQELHTGDPSEDPPGPHLHFPGDRHPPAFPGLSWPLPSGCCVSWGCLFEPLASRPPVRVFCFFIDCRILYPCSVRILSFTGIGNRKCLLPHVVLSIHGRTF